MSDDHSWRRGLKRWLSTAPETRDDLLNLVQDSRRFLDSDMVDMLEGVLDLPAMAVKEIMTPRPDVRAITSSDGIQTVLATIFESNHSRYPVIDEADDNAVMGILLVKDLIPYLVQKSAGQNPPIFTQRTGTKTLVYLGDSTFRYLASLIATGSGAYGGCG